MYSLKRKGKIQEILKYPHPVLAKKARNVESFDETLESLLLDMLETMYHSKGIGLAAPQIGISLRVLVMDLSEVGEEKELYKIVNPKIISTTEETDIQEEGCLSVPGVQVPVKRPQGVRFSYFNEKGEEKVVDAEGMLARCFLHELDHLEGKTFFAHLSSVRRSRILKVYKPDILPSEE